jgi:hypothetical protein
MRPSGLGPAGGTLGIACKKVYSEQNFEKTLSQAVKQVKDFEIGIVAINIDDVTPADTVLNVRNHQEMNRKLQGLCEGFLQRHERHLRKYLSKERLVAALISIQSPTWSRARPPDAEGGDRM